MSNINKQFWSLRWNLAVLVMSILAVPFVSYHFFIKKEKIREVEVPVEVIKEVPVEGIECPFLECYSYRGFSMWYQKPLNCCYEIAFCVKYKNDRQKYILENALPKFKKIFGKHYDGVEYDFNMMCIELDDYFGKLGSKYPQREVLNNDDMRDMIFNAIDVSEEEMIKMFKEESKLIF